MRVKEENKIRQFWTGAFERHPRNTLRTRSFHKASDMHNSDKVSLSRALSSSLAICLQQCHELAESPRPFPLLSPTSEHGKFTQNVFESGFLPALTCETRRGFPASSRSNTQTPKRPRSEWCQRCGCAYLCFICGASSRCFEARGAKALSLQRSRCQKPNDASCDWILKSPVFSELVIIIF